MLYTAILRYKLDIISTHIEHGVLNVVVA